MSNKFVTLDQLSRVVYNLKNKFVSKTFIDSKQDKTDSSLQTTSKQVVGAINELNTNKQNLNYGHLYVAGISNKTQDTAIFDFTNSGITADSLRLSEIQVFTTSMVNPVNGNTINGVMEVLEYMVKSGGAYTVYIEQRFTQLQSGNVNNIIKFVRKGSVALDNMGQYTNWVASKGDSISWKRWIPTDYPPTIVSGDCKIAVKGGFAVLDLYGTLTPTGTGDQGELFTLIEAFRPQLEVHGVIKNNYGQTSGANQTVWVGTSGVVKCWQLGFNFTNVRGSLFFPLGY